MNFSRNHILPIMLFLVLGLGVSSCSKDVDDELSLLVPAPITGGLPPQQLNCLVRGFLFEMRF